MKICKFLSGLAPIAWALDQLWGLTRESDDEENQDEYEGSGVEEGEGEEADVAQHRRGRGGVGGGRVVVTLKLLDVYIL